MLKGGTTNMYSYIVCIDPNIRLPVEASNASEAKEEAWKQIAGGFTFGNNRKAFMQKARVVTVGKAEQVTLI